MPQDITVIYITASQIPEKFGEYQRNILKQAIGPAPLISISRKPLDFGLNILDVEPKSLSNIYYQILKALEYVKTPYIAIAEDDTLYPKEHFTFHRPKPDTFAYDQNRLALFTWGEPMYHWRNRKSNCSLIAPTILLKEALEERFTKWPQGTPDDITGEVGRRMVEKNMGLIIRKSEEVFCKYSLIQINHEAASEERQRTHRKSYGPIKAYDIPIWGKADNLLKQFYEYT